MDSEQANGPGDLFLTLCPEEKPTRMIINWQVGKALVFLANGAMIEANTPGRLEIQWAERRETPKRTERQE